MKTFSKLVGQTFPRPSQKRKGIDIIPELSNGIILKLVREPDNQFDKNAVQVWHKEEMVGFIPAHTAVTLASEMDNGIDHECSVSEVTGGGDKNYGCNIKIYPIGEDNDEPEVSEDPLGWL